MLRYSIISSSMAFSINGISHTRRDSCDIVNLAQLKTHVQMEQLNPFSVLPSDVIIQEIMTPMLQEKKSLQTLANFMTIDKSFKKLCKTRVIRSCINLSAHTVFDHEKPTGYVSFMLKCADANNKYACLLFGMSMCFCFGQSIVGTKYLGKIRKEDPVAEYVHAIFTMQNQRTRMEGVAAISKLRRSPVEDHIDKIRVKSIRMLVPGLRFNTYLKSLYYTCAVGSSCNRKHKAKNEWEDPDLNLTCADKHAATVEYNLFRKAVIARVHYVR